MRSTTTTPAVPRSTTPLANTVGVRGWRCHRRTRRTRNARFEAKRREPSSEKVRLFKKPKASNFLSETGLRYYTPEPGRWLNRDPIGEEGGVNLYVVVGNDLIGWWDFLGMEKLELHFEMIPPCEFTVFESLSQPADTIWVNKLDQIVGAINEAVSDDSYHADGIGGDCISLLVLSAHGAGSGVLPLGDREYRSFDYKRYRNTIDAWKYGPEALEQWKEENKEWIDEFSETQTALELAACRMCEEAKVVVLVCYAGEGGAGANLQRQLEDIFGQGVTVVTYSNECGYFFGRPTTSPIWDPLNWNKHKSPKR